MPTILRDIMPLHSNLNERELVSLLVNLILSIDLNISREFTRNEGIIKQDIISFLEKNQNNNDFWNSCYSSLVNFVVNKLIEIDNPKIEREYLNRITRNISKILPKNSGQITFDFYNTAVQISRNINDFSKTTNYLEKMAILAEKNDKPDLALEIYKDLITIHFCGSPYDEILTLRTNTNIRFNFYKFIPRCSISCYY